MGISSQQYNPQYDSGPGSTDDVRWIECLTGVIKKDVFGIDVLRSGLWNDVQDGVSPANTCCNVTITEVDEEESGGTLSLTIELGVVNTQSDRPIRVPSSNVVHPSITSYFVQTIKK